MRYTILFAVLLIAQTAYSAEPVITSAAPGFAQSKVSVPLIDDFSPGGNFASRYQIGQQTGSALVTDSDGYLRIQVGPAIEADSAGNVTFARHFFAEDSFVMSVDLGVGSSSIGTFLASLAIMNPNNPNDTLSLIGLTQFPDANGVYQRYAVAGFPNEPVLETSFIYANGTPFAFADNSFQTATLDYDAVTHTIIASIPSIGYSRTVELSAYGQGFVILFEALVFKGVDPVTLAPIESFVDARFDNLTSDLTFDTYEVSFTPLQYEGVTYNDSYAGDPQGGDAVYFFLPEFPIPLLRVSTDNTWMPLDGVTSLNGYLATAPGYNFTIYSPAAPDVIANAFGLSVVGQFNGIYAAQGAGQDYSWTLPRGAPYVTEIYPLEGAAYSAVTIVGERFGPQGELLLNGLPVQTTNWSDTRIEFLVPDSFEAQRYELLVVSGGQQSNTTEFLVIPAVVDVLPLPIRPGNEFSILGSGFGEAAPGKQVVLRAQPLMSAFSLFAFTAAVSEYPVEILSWTSTEISAIAPADMPAGLYTVSVQMNGIESVPLGVSVMSSDPVIDTVTPQPAAPSSEITISGSNFGFAGGIVYLDGYEIQTLSWSDTAITLQIPSDWPHGEYPLWIGTGSLVSNEYTMVIGARLDSVSPTLLQPGDTFVLQGSGFGSVKSNAAVLVGGFPVRIDSLSDTYLVARLPTMFPAGSYNVEVSILGYESNALPVTVQPEITKISVSGSKITIEGYGFGDVPSSVTLGGQPTTVLSWLPDRIQVQVPSSVMAGFLPLVVSAGGVASAPIMVAFAPILKMLSPAIAAPGDEIIITGAHFGVPGSQALVTLDRTASYFATVLSDESIAFTLPLRADGRDSMVITVGGVSSNALVLEVRSEPLIYSLSPAATPPGSTVTVFGRSFGVSPGRVELEYRRAKVSLSPTTWSPGTITFLLPNDLTPATYKATIVSTSGQASNGIDLLVTVNPYINSVSPSVAKTGDLIKLVGVNFGASPGTVFFGRALSVVAQAWNDNEIIVQVPQLLDGSTSVYVSTGGLISNSVSLQISSKPQISDLLPKEGPAGTEVTILGTNFRDTQGLSELKLNELQIPPTSWSDSKIVFYIPDGTLFGRKDVYVLVNGVESNHVSYLVGAGISALDPVTATGGMHVTVSGGGFGASQGEGSFTIGGITANVITWSDTEVVLVMPDTVRSGLREVRPMIPDSRTRVTANAHVYPTLKSLTPEMGTAGVRVAATGTNFYQDGAVVAGIQTRTNVNSATQLSFSVPSEAVAGATTVYLKSVIRDSNALSFTVLPAIHRFDSPAEAGSVVRLRGSNFGPAQGDSTLTIDTTPVTILSWSDSTISFRMPISLAVGVYPLTLTVGGQAISKEITILPAVTTVSPGRATGGDVVTLTGFAFGDVSPDSAVLLGGVSIPISSWNNRAITFVVPDDLPGGSLSLRVNVGTFQSKADSLIVTPTIISYSPREGEAGTDIEISGTNFSQQSGSVRIGSVEVLSTWRTSKSASAKLTAFVEPGMQLLTVWAGGGSFTRSRIYGDSTDQFDQ